MYQHVLNWYNISSRQEIKSSLIDQSQQGGEIMYCPICRAEYREGFYECTDCDTDLVEELGPLPDALDFIKLATIFNEGDIAVIKASLDKAGIQYYFEGEQSHRLAPVPLSARLMVREDFKGEAESILKELEII
jgi:hypothetical protein